MLPAIPVILGRQPPTDCHRLPWAPLLGQTWTSPGLHEMVRGMWVGGFVGRTRLCLLPTDPVPPSARRGGTICYAEGSPWECDPSQATVTRGGCVAIIQSPRTHKRRGLGWGVPGPHCCHLGEVQAWALGAGRTLHQRAAAPPPWAPRPFARAALSLLVSSPRLQGPGLPTEGPTPGTAISSVHTHWG